MKATEWDLWLAAAGGDEGARRVLADWLLEQGDPAGELIAGRAHADRERALLAQQREVWARRFGFAVAQVHFEGGLPTELVLRDVRLFRQDMRAQDQGDHDLLVALLDVPYLALLRSLRLENNRLGPAGAALVAASPRLTGLTALHVVGNRVGAGGLAALLASPHLQGLVHLDVSGNDLEPASLLELPPHNLHSMALGKNTLGDEGVANLVRHRLPLSRLDLDSNGIGRKGAIALAKSAMAPQLVQLGLHGNPIGRAALRALARGKLSHLALLELGTTDVRAGLVELGELLQNAPIRTLGLGNNKLKGEPLETLAALPGLAGLTSLDLRLNPLDLQDLQLLAASPHLQGLDELCLVGTQLTDAASRGLEGPLLSIPSLDLRNNRLTVQGARELAPRLSGSTRVRLAGNPILAEEKRTLLAEHGSRLSFE